MLLLIALGCEPATLPPPAGQFEAEQVQAGQSQADQFDGNAASPAVELAAASSPATPLPAAEPTAPPPTVPFPEPPAPPAAVRHADATDPAGVRLVGGFDCSPKNLDVTAVGPGHFAVRFPGGGRDAVGYFLFRVEGAAGKELTIDLTNVPIDKWWSLNPVVCDDADPAALANFVSRPAKQNAKPAKAPNGPLLPDTSGERWQFIKNVTPDRGAKTLTLRHTFTSDACLLAMRPPYTPAYHANYLDSLRDNPNVTLHEIGTSGGGRPLNVIQVGGQTEEARRKNPCILIYAREHADEHDSSWVAQGAAGYLLLDDKEAKRLRNKITLLVIPLLDPDGAVDSRYDHITQSWDWLSTKHEPTVYAKFLKQWVDAGNRLDLIVNLHNVESNESGHLACPAIPGESARKHCYFELHERIVAAFKASGYDASSKVWSDSHSLYRLGGWAMRMLGAMHLPYEVNSQAPKRHLALGELRLCGALLVDTAGRHLNSPAGRETLAYTDNMRRTRARKWLLSHGNFDLDWDSTALKAEEGMAMSPTPEEAPRDEKYARFLQLLEVYPQYR